MVATRLLSIGAAAFLVASVAASPNARLLKRQDTTPDTDDSPDMDDTDDSLVSSVSSMVSSLTATGSTSSVTSASATGASGAVPTIVENCHGHGSDLYCVADGVEWEVLDDSVQEPESGSFGNCVAGEDDDDLTCQDASGNAVALEREGAVHDDDDNHSHGTTSAGASQTPSGTGAGTQSTSATAGAAGTASTTTQGGAGAKITAAPMALAAILALAL